MSTGRRHVISEGPRETSQAATIRQETPVSERSAQPRQATEAVEAAARVAKARRADEALDPHDLAKLSPDELRAKTFEAVASSRRDASPFWRL